MTIEAYPECLGLYRQWTYTRVTGLANDNSANDNESDNVNDNSPEPGDVAVGQIIYIESCAGCHGSLGEGGGGLALAGTTAERLQEVFIDGPHAGGAFPRFTDADFRALEAFLVAEGADVEPECAIDAECDDGDACTIDECVAGECVFTFIPCGNPPTALAQVVGTRVNEAIPITLSATDPDGEALTYLIVEGPAQGALTGNPPEVTYAPDENYVGFDSFSFQTDDGRSGVLSNTAKVRIWVIDEGDLSGQTVRGYLVPGDTDVWTFPGAAGQRVAIRVSYNWPSNARLALYPPGGGNMEVSTSDRRIDWGLQNTGQYTVAVENPSSTVSIGYDLSVLVVGGQLASLSDLDGGPITAGESLVGQLASTGDLDAYTFEGIAGQRVLITINKGWPTSADFVLYPPGGGEREASSSNLKIDRTLAATGLYTVVVEKYLSGTFPSIGYNLTLQQF
ncbi:MAG: Ig-like domain-containing protein [Planctomycetota bacterium]